MAYPQWGIQVHNRAMSAPPLVPVDPLDVRVGLPTRVDIFDVHGQLLLARGSTVYREDSAERLQQAGFKCVATSQGIGTRRHEPVFQRMEVLAAAGLTMTAMRENGVGPVLFREEARFIREIRPNDTILMVATVTGLGRDHRKFGIRHDFMRGGECCAVVQVDGAWFSSTERRIIVPPQVVIEAMNNFPRADDFAWIERAG